MKISRKTCAAIVRAAARASVNSGGIREVQLASRYGRTQPLPGGVKTLENLIDTDIDTTDLWDSLPFNGRSGYTIEDSAEFPDGAVLELWTYSGDAEYRELEDTVYVGVVRNVGVVGVGSPKFERVKAAVLAALAKRSEVSA